MYQSLSELQFAIVTSSDQSAPSKQEKNPASDINSIRIGFLARSVFIPTQISAAKQDEFEITGSEDFLAIGRESRKVKLGARAAASIYADLLRIRSSSELIQDKQPAFKWISFEMPNSLYFHLIRGKTLPGDKIFRVDAHAAKAWAQWVPTDGMTFSDFLELPLDQFASELTSGIAEVIDHSLIENSDLAEKYVAIRTDIAKRLKSDHD